MKLKHFLNDKTAILTIILVGLVLYWHSLGNGFVGDDQSQVIDNTALHSITNIPYLFSASSFDNGGSLTGIYYKPLMSSFYAATYTFFGPNPTAYHTLSVAVHIANSVLVFLVLAYFLPEIPSLFLALIFLVHPINNQSPLYISALQDDLFFLFGMIALELVQAKKFTLWRLILTLVMLLFSVLSKETGVLFFPIVIIFKYLFDRKHILILTITEAAVFGLYVFLRIRAIGLHPGTAPNAPIATQNLLERVTSMPSIFLFYIRTFIFPKDLSISWQWTVQKFSLTGFFVPLLIVVIVLGLLIYLAVKLKRSGSKSFKSYLFFLSVLLIGLIFHSQVIALDATVAERWFYLPIVGLLGIIGIITNKYVHAGNLKIICVFACLTILLLSIGTYVRSLNFKDNLTLGNHDIKVSTDAYDLESMLGNEYILTGDLETAKMHTQRSVELFPYITNLNNLGLIYLKLGDKAKAEELYRKAIAIAPFYLPYQNLSVLLTAYGDPKEAEKFTADAINKFPNNAKLWLYFSVIEYNLKRYDVAKTAIQRAYALDQSEPINGVYQSLMNNQPLDIRFSIN
jgi:tetratricopeptide (TPR) repeat protein